MPLDANRINALIVALQPTQIPEFLLREAGKRRVSFILEVGCGSGKLSYQMALAEPNWHYTLLDRAIEPLAVAAPLATVISMIVGNRLNAVLGCFDAVNLHETFKEKSFDLCFSEGMMNLQTPEHQLLLVKRQLDVADKVVAIMPNASVAEVAAKYAERSNRAVWGYPYKPDEVLKAWSEALVGWRGGEHAHELRVRLEYPILGRDNDRQFAIVAEWVPPRRKLL